MKVFDKNKNFLLCATRKNNLYYLKYIICKENDKSVSVSANQTEKLNVSKLWHERFCHVDNEHILDSSRNKSVKSLHQSDSAFSYPM